MSPLLSPDDKLSGCTCIVLLNHGQWRNRLLKTVEFIKGKGSGVGLHSSYATWRMHTRMNLAVRYKVNTCRQKLQNE